MNYIIIDLEFNNLQDILTYDKYFYEKYPSISNEECPNEIIEIGAVKLDKFMRVVETLKVFIKPTIYPILNPRITEITGIGEENLKEGLNFRQAMDKLVSFFGEEPIICSWAKDDIAGLVTNSYFHNYEDLSWMKKYIDIQEYYTKVFAEKKSPSLKNALDKLKIKVNENKLHDALYDAEYTAEVFKRIFNARIIKNYIVEDIVNMPSIVIRDFSNFNLDGEKIKVKCPKCTSEVDLELPLKLFNWKFWGLGYCGTCKSKLFQEVVIKKTLNGENIYDNIIKIVDDVEYENFTYKYKHIG